jgi:hypothetical protein
MKGLVSTQGQRNPRSDLARVTSVTAASVVVIVVVFRKLLNAGSSSRGQLFCSAGLGRLRDATVLDGETRDPTTRTALQFEAIEPHKIAVIIFLVERYNKLK